MRHAAAILRGSVLAAALAASSLAAAAQEPGEQAAPQGGARGGQVAGIQRVAGQVSAVSGANVTVKSIENGQTMIVVTTANTRLMKGPGEPLDLGGLKPGDGVLAMGQLDAPNNTLHAAMVMALSADQTKQMQTAAAEMKANLGKTYIAGRVTAVDIENFKLTVQRPDGQAQTIGFDDGTSFRKGGRVTGIGGGMVGFGGGYGRRGRNGSGSGNAPGGQPGAQSGSQPGSQSGAANVPAISGGESITLADIKVGDNVVGLGAVKAGTFVPSTLNVQVRGEGGRRRGGPEGGGAPGNGSGQPAPTGPQLR